MKKGLLTRKRSKADRRHVAIEITLQGKKQLWEAIPVAITVRGLTESGPRRIAYSFASQLPARRLPTR